MAVFDLIGAVETTIYCEEIESFIKNNNGYCWSGWTYPMALDKYVKLVNNLFCLYIYTSEKKEVTHIFHCNEIRNRYSEIIECPDPDNSLDHQFDNIYKTWMCVYDVEEVSIPIDTLIKLSDDKPVMPQGLRDNFSYIHPLEDNY